MIRTMMNSQLDFLEESNRRLIEEVDELRHALYAACADLISINYPNNHMDVDELFDKYVLDQKGGNDEL